MSLVITDWGFNSLITAVIQVSKVMGFLNLLRFETLEGNKVLQLDPAIDGVFKGPYPIGIDPVNIFLCDLYLIYSANFKTSYSLHAFKPCLGK